MLRSQRHRQAGRDEGGLGGALPQIPAPTPGWIRLPGTGSVCSPSPGAYWCCLPAPAGTAFAFGAGRRAPLQSCRGVIVTGRYQMLLPHPANPPCPGLCRRNGPSGPRALVPAGPRPLRSAPALVRGDTGAGAAAAGPGGTCHPPGEGNGARSPQCLSFPTREGRNTPLPSSAHQAPSSFPAELRPPAFSQDQAGKPQWRDANGYLEKDGFRGEGGTQLCRTGSSLVGETEARSAIPSLSSSRRHLRLLPQSGGAAGADGGGDAEAVPRRLLHLPDVPPAAGRPALLPERRTPHV